MNVEAIVTELKQERDRITAAINALEGNRRGPGRRPGRHMSAEARARISAAMRKKWAERKSGSKVRQMKAGA